MISKSVTLSIIDDWDGRWRRLVFGLIVDWWNEENPHAKLNILDISTDLVRFKTASERSSIPEGIELWVANDIAESLAMIQRTRNARSSSLVWIAGDFSMEETLIFTRIGVNGWIADGDDLLRWRPTLKRRFSRPSMLFK